MAFAPYVARRSLRSRQPSAAGALLQLRVALHSATGGSGGGARRYLLTSTRLSRLKHLSNHQAPQGLGSGLGLGFGFGFEFGFGFGFGLGLGLGLGLVLGFLAPEQPPGPHRHCSAHHRRRRRVIMALAAIHHMGGGGTLRLHLGTQRSCQTAQQRARRPHHCRRGVRRCRRRPLACAVGRLRRSLG